MRNPMFRNFGVLVASVATAWSTATGSLDVRFSMAVVVAAGIFWGRGAFISGLAGLGSAYLLFGSSMDHSIVDGHIGALIAITVLAILETLALFVAIERTIARVHPVTPAARIWKFLLCVALISVVGGWSETLLVSWINRDVAMASVSQGIGIAIAAIIAAIASSRKGSHWFRYDKSVAAELLAPLVIVLMTLVAIEITRQVWERQDEDNLTFVAEAAQTGFLKSTANSCQSCNYQGVN